MHTKKFLTNTYADSESWGYKWLVTSHQHCSSGLNSRANSVQ